MKKIKKIMAGIMAAAMISSVGGMSVSAADKHIEWKYEIPSNGNPSMDNVICYDDGSCIRATKYFARIIVTVPENITPDIKYFGIDRISSINEFDVVCYESEKVEEDIWNEVEPRDNEYVLNIYLDGTLVELEEECKEYARKLLSEGKIESARTWERYSTYNIDSIDSISIITDETVSDFELKETDGRLSHVRDNKYYLFDVTDEKNGMIGIMDLCDTLVNNYSFIVDAFPNVPDFPINDYEYQENYVTENIYMWGDATNDDIIDLYDAIEISKHIMGIGELDEDTILLADINRDGETNLYDAVEIAKSLM